MSTGSERGEQAGGEEHRTAGERNLDQAARDAGTTRERVERKGEANKQSKPPIIHSAHGKQGDSRQAQPLEKASGLHPGDVSPQLGQDSGSDWQESQQMGQTGHGGVQKP